MNRAISLLLRALAITVCAAADTEPSYPMASGDACILQIMKETSPNLIMACGDQVKVNNTIQAYSQMQNATVFQSEAKRIFLARVASNLGIQCNEYDNSTMYLMVCKKP